MTVQSSETSRLYRVFSILFVLLGITMAAAFAPLGKFSIAVALCIAVMKTIIVAFHFMELRNASAKVVLFACAGMIWLSILIGMTMSEYAARPPAPGPNALVGRMPAPTGVQR